ncbi:hypothetical protein GCM10023097_39960 [Streptomyces collinus]
MKAKVTGTRTVLAAASNAGTGGGAPPDAVRLRNVRIPMPRIFASTVGGGAFSGATRVTVQWGPGRGG